MIEAEDLRAALTFTSVRGDKRDRIDFEMGARGCMNVGRWLDLDDPAPFSEQETAAFLGIRIVSLNHEVGNKST